MVSYVDDFRPGSGRRTSVRQPEPPVAVETEARCVKHSYLFIDDAVHGIGSRSCGVDVLPQYALWPSRREFRLIFTEPETLATALDP